MRMVSIDSSTRRTGMALFVDGRLYDFTLVDLSKSAAETDLRISIMGKEILDVLNMWMPDSVYIESPRGDGRNVELVRKLSEILGIVRGWCIGGGKFYEEVMPSVWRKHCGLEQGKKKRADLKAESVAYVKEKYGVEVNDDVADSICIGDAMVVRYSDEQ